MPNSKKSSQNNFNHQNILIKNISAVAFYHYIQLVFLNNSSAFYLIWSDCKLYIPLFVSLRAIIPVFDWFYFCKLLTF